MQTFLLFGINSVLGFKYYKYNNLMKMIIFRENLHTLDTLNAKKIFVPNIYLVNKNYARRFDNSKYSICD